MGVTTTQSTNGGATWRQIHKRAIYKRRADSSTPAFFVHQRWDLTSAAAGRYKARVYVFFYETPGKTREEGKTVLEADNYYLSHGTTQLTSPSDYCPAVLT